MEDAGGFEKMDLLGHIRDLVHSGENKKALELCKRGMREYADEKVAFVMLAGHAALGEKSDVDAEKAYKKVLDTVHSTSDTTMNVQGCMVESRVVELEAWKGLAQVYALRGDLKGQAESLENILKVTPEDDPNDKHFRIELAEKYVELGEHEKSQHQFWHVLHSMPIGSQERLDCLCKMADSMLKQKETHVKEEVELKIQDSGIHGDVMGVADRTVSCIKLDVMAAVAAKDDELHDVGVSLNHILVEIMETSPASLKYLPYREEYLQRCLLRIFHHPPRSAERQQFRLAALRECVKIICTGGACSSFAFEAAVWLLEEEEEITGGQVSVGGQEVGGLQAVAGGVQAGAEGHIGQGRQATVAFAVENFSRRMYHQFPTNPTARVLMTLMVRRRAMLSKHPVPQAERRKWEEALEDAMKDDDAIDCASGFKALSELHYENRHYQKAHDASLRGLKWLQERRDRGHESLSQVGLGLRLVLAKSLRRLNRLDEAEEQFKALTGWVSEGEVAFCEMCGSAPTSIHQQALRGTALVAVERGDLDAALSQYERILGKAALGRGPAEHWAHADYGWLLYQRADLEQARFHLENAIRVSEEENCAATDSQVGEHHYRLGEVYWALGGKFKTDKQFAYTMFYESAKVEGHAQASAVAALGRYYDEVEQNSATAQRCYKKALSIDPSLKIAGEFLCRHMLQEGKSDEDIISLCSVLQSRHPEATWVYREIGAARLRQQHWADAVAPLLKAVKLDGKDVLSWENLGLSYFNLGRLASSKKALDRALVLEKDRPYGSLICSWISVHAPDEDQAMHPKFKLKYPLYFLSEAYRAFQKSLCHMFNGALCTAVPLLITCDEYLRHYMSMDGKTVAAFKLKGDIAFLQFKTKTLAKILSDEEVQLSQLVEHREGAKSSTKRAYAKAIHLRPCESSLWSNMCLSFGEKISSEEDEDENLLAPVETVERCLRASVQLRPDSFRNWFLLGCFMFSRNPSLSKYSLIRALQLNKKDFKAWECLSKVMDMESLEQGFCERQAQAYKEDNLDVWSRVVSSKCNTDSDIYSRINVADVFGPHLMESYMQACFADDAPDGSMAFPAALTASCLDPFNPDLLVSLWLTSLRYGKFKTCEKICRLFHDEMQGTPVGAEIGASSLWNIGMYHVSNITGTSVTESLLPFSFANDPEYAKKLSEYIQKAWINDTMKSQMLFFLFDTILTFYRMYPAKYEDSMVAIKDLLLHSKRCIENISGNILLRLNTLYEIIDQTEGIEGLLLKLQKDWCPFLRQHREFSTLVEAANCLSDKVGTLNNTIDISDQDLSVDDPVKKDTWIKTLHMYPWMMVSV